MIFTVIRESERLGPINTFPRVVQVIETLWHDHEPPVKDISTIFPLSLLPNSIYASAKFLYTNQQTVITVYMFTQT